MKTALAALLLAATAVTSASAAGRALVYNFTFGVDNQTTEAASANGFGSGPGVFEPIADTNGRNEYNGKASDRGQIFVDVKGIEPDGGLVVEVSEKAQNRRSAGAVPCVVYASTNVRCGEGMVNPEEIAVIRTFSPHFFDASQLDAKGHWQIENRDAGVKIDFTATPASDGLFQITSERNETLGGQNRGSVVTSAKYVYDPTRYVPNSLTEYATYRQSTATGAFSTTTVNVTAQLVDAAKPQ